MSNSQKLQTKDKDLVPEWYIATRIIRSQAIGCSFFDFFDFKPASITNDGAIVSNGSPSGIPVSGDAGTAETPQSGFTCPHCGQPLFLTTSPE